MPKMLSSFYIAGGGDPDGCTRELGLSPTSTRRVGVKRTSNHPAPRENEWAIATAWGEFESVEDALSPLLASLWEIRERITTYCHRENAEAGLMVAIELGDERPVYDLSRDSISKLAALNAEFGLDIYDRRSE